MEETQAQLDWKARARAFLAKKRCRDDGSAEANMPAPKYRKKSCAWIVAVHNVVEKCTGESLDYFRQNPDVEERSHPSQWPYLGLCPDQGPDGTCGSFYMLARGINCERWWDISHGVWNDQDRDAQFAGG